MRRFSLFFCILLCFSLFSCSVREPDSYNILLSLMEDCGPMPAGVIYTPRAEEGEQGYMSEALAEALWGEDAAEGFGLLSDFAIYMSSFASPYEIGVFCCYSSTDADRVEELCMSRADIISVALRQTEFYGLCGNVRVVKRGRVVIFLMTDAPDVAVRRALSLIS